MPTARLLEASDVDGFVRALPLIRPDEGDDPDAWKATLRDGNRNPFGAIRFAIVEEGGEYLSMAATTPKPMRCSPMIAWRSAATTWPRCGATAITC